METFPRPRRTLRWATGGGALALLAIAAPALSDTSATHTVCATGCDFTTLSAAIAAAAPLDAITVAAGSYSGNAVITKALTITGAGIGQSTLVGTSGQGALGTLVIATGVSNVTIEGFTIEGIDNGNAAVENAAVYIQGGGHDAITVRNNRIVANGDLGLASEFGSTMTNVSVTGNTFSGATYTGSAPASVPFSQQFTTANVARQFVVFGNGGGTGTSNVNGFVFTGNTIDGSAGVGAYGNTLATLDVSGATITGNTFAGQTGGSASMLRVRRAGNTISGNTFTTTGVQGSASALFVQNQTLPLSTIVGANTFDRAVYVDATGTGTVGVGLAAAVAAVPAGTTLRVVGTHTLGSTLEVNKALTIEGTGAGSTTLDFRTSGAYGVRTSAAGITVKDLKILGPTTSSSAAYAFKAEGSTTTTKVAGLTVSGVEITGSRKTALDVNGYTGVTLSNVTVSGTTNGRGIALTDVDNATLEGITTSGNAWGGVAIAVYGRYAPIGSDNVSITSLTASETNPIDWDMGNYNAPGTLVTPTNFNAPAGYDAYTVRRPFASVSPTAFSLWSFTPSRANALTMGAATANATIVRPGNSFLVGPGMSLSTAIAAATPLSGSSVEDADGNFHVASGMGIQPALDAASAGATVSVAAGTYTGALTVAKGLTIAGAGPEAATGTVIASASGAVVTLTGSGTSSAPLTLQDLRISAPARHGLYVPSGSVSHVRIDGVHVVGSNPTTQLEDAGLWVSAAASLTDLTVVDSRFEDMQYGWYFAKHGSWTGGSTVDRVSVSSTTFDGNMGKGIYAEKLSNATFDGVSVTNNGLNGGQFNAPFNAGIDLNLKGNDVAYQNLVFEDLTVTGNAVGQQNGVGMVVKARSDGATYGTYPATLSGVTIRGGTFSGNEAGLRIGEPGKANAGPSGVVVTDVTFGDNVQMWSGGTSLNRALINETTASVSAENNWWGSADATVVASRISNTSTGSVDYDPWTGKPVALPAPVVGTPVAAAGTPVELTFTSLPTSSQPVTVRFEPTEPDASSQALPDPAASIAGATATLPATLTMTTSMSNYTFRTSVTLDVSSIPGFGPDTRVAYFNTTTNSYVPINGTYAAGPPATFTFDTDHFTTFVFYNGSAADPMDLFVSSTTSVPATGEEYVTPSGSWSDAGSGADDWTYTGQTATFHVVPSFPTGFDGLSSMSLVFSYDPAVMAFSGATFNGDWGFTQCQNGVPAAGRVTCDLSTMNASAEVLTSMTGAALSLSFTASAPGYSALDIIGADIRKLDGVGGYTGVAVTTHGGGLRNYLGDVVARTGASTTDATRGDGKVDFDDLSVFTQSYWAGVTGYTGPATYRDKADIGPTTGVRARTVYGTPSVDGKVDFEDLVLFAASYGLSGRNVYPEAREGATDEAEAPVEVIAGAAYLSGDLVAIPVELSAVRDLRAGSFLVDLGAGAQLVGARVRGSLAGQRDGFAMARMEGGLARVDAAVLGGDGLAGSGSVVEVLVRASAPVAARVTAADLRSVTGETIASSVLKTTGVNDLPMATELALESVFPNPARGRATVRVAVPTAQSVEVVIFDALGREVSVLTRGEIAAGRHDLPVSTDGLSSGLYIVRMRAGAFSRTQTLTVVQ